MHVNAPPVEMLKRSCVNETNEGEFRELLGRFVTQKKTRTNVSKSRVLKVLSSPEEEEQEQEEEEEEKQTTKTSTDTALTHGAVG